MNIGFTFNNVHSSTVGVVFKSVDRTLLPGKRTAQYIIPGRDGTHDVEGDYENREISCLLSFIGTDDQYPGLRSKARAIAKWLSGEGLLIFDDEPERAYQAKVVSGIGIDQAAVVGRSNVVFSCQPFAESIEYNQVNETLTENPSEVAAEVAATISTCCIITIKNTGETDISNISIKRKAAI